MHAGVVVGVVSVGAVADAACVPELVASQRSQPRVRLGAVGAFVELHDVDVAAPGEGLVVTEGLPLPSGCSVGVVLDPDVVARAVLGVDVGAVELGEPLVAGDHGLRNDAWGFDALGRVVRVGQVVLVRRIRGVLRSRRRRRR